MTVAETFPMIDMDRRAYCRNRRIRYPHAIIRIERKQILMQAAIERIASLPGMREANAVHHCVARDEFGWRHGGSVSHLRWILRTPKRVLRVWCEGMIEERDAADRAAAERAGGAA